MFVNRIKGLFKPPARPAVQWVLTANQTQARIFQHVQGYEGYTVVARLEHPQTLENHPMDMERTPHNPEVERFAKLIGDMLQKSRAKNRYDELVLVAEPKLLGIINNHLEAPTKRVIVHKISKNLSGWKDDEVWDYVNQKRKAV